MIFLHNLQSWLACSMFLSEIGFKQNRPCSNGNTLFYSTNSTCNRNHEKVSEYDQKIPQSHYADQRGRATEHL